MVDLVLHQGLAIDEMRGLLRTGVGDLTEEQLPNQKADQLLNMAFWDLADNFDFKETEETWTHTIVEADETEAIPVPVELGAFHNLSIIDGQDRRFKLTLQSRQDYETMRNTNLIGGHGRPERYHRWNDQLFLWPFPTSYQNGWTLVASIESPIESFAETLPRSWHRIIVHRAVEVYHAFKREWVLASAANNYTSQVIRQQVSVAAKEDSDDDWAALDAYTARPCRPWRGSKRFNRF